MVELIVAAFVISVLTVGFSAMFKFGARADLDKMSHALLALPGTRGMRDGSTLLLSRVTTHGETQLEITNGLRGMRVRAVHALSWVDVGPFVTLWPVENVIDGLHVLTGIDLGAPKPSLPTFSGREGVDVLLDHWDTALPDIRRGSVPVISRAEAAWVLRLILHPATDGTLLERVLTDLDELHVSRSGDRERILALLQFFRDKTPADELPDSLFDALVVRDALIRLDAEGKDLSCDLRDGGVEVVLRFKDGLRKKASARLLDALDALTAALVTFGGGEGSEPTLLCPVDGNPLSPSGSDGEYACASCAGRLLLRDALRTIVLEPLGKTPGDLKEAAADARSDDVWCPSCQRATAPVYLEDVIADLCTSCGALWLEEGELSTLSLGRYDG